LMARQEQDMTQPHAQGAVGGQFPPSMSPGGSRAGPSPNPTDMKRGTPKLPQQGLPTSPMPDPSMQQRGSPAPMAFDPSQMPPGMPPQIPGQFPGYNQMQQPMMRPPSSHPNFNGQQLTPQQMEMMRQNGGMPNGGPWRGPGPQGMFQPGQQPGGPMNNMPQRGQMPPPPAPPAGEQPRAEPSPSQPAAPPTPKTQTKKKPTKDTKVMLCDPDSPVSIVDIDCRSPRKRKGQTQVRRQPRQLKTLRRRRRRRLRSRPCTSSHSLRTGSSQTSLHPSPPLFPRRHCLWTMVRRLAMASTT
jgi:hypothetical protein